MRKVHLEAMVNRLKERNDELKRERDEAQNVVHAALVKLRDGAESHKAELLKLREEVAGLAESVRASLLARAEKGTANGETAAPVKAGSKAAGR